MSYLHCPRCRLSIADRRESLMLVNCPRCLARAAVAAPLFVSPLRASQLHAIATATATATDRAGVELR